VNFVERVMERIGAVRDGRVWRLPEEYQEEFGEALEDGDDYAATLIALRLPSFGVAEGRRDFAITCVNCREEVLSEAVEHRNLLSIGVRVEYRHVRLEEEVLEFLYDPESRSLMEFSALKGLNLVDREGTIDESLIKDAMDALRGVVERRASEVERRALDEARKDVERVREYHERMIREEEEEIRGLIQKAEEYERKMFLSRKAVLRERYNRLRLKALEKATELMNALESKRESYRRRIEEYERREMERARVRADVHLEGAVLIRIPRIRRVVKFVSDDAERVEVYEYDHFRDTLSLKCRCGAELRDVYLTSSGLLVCPVCRRECAVCGKVMSIYEVHHICAACGATLCQEHSKRCSVCGKHFCDDHSVKCDFCSSVMCTEHASACSVCGATLCPDHLASCAVCSASLCPAHWKECALCGGNICKEHAVKCMVCGRTLCTECAVEVNDEHSCPEHVSRCGVCGVRGVNLERCAVCGAPICETHRAVCSVCGRVVCPEHGVACHTCGAVLCPDHTEKCIVCGVPLCDEHVHTCEVCSADTCEEHSHVCPVCGSTLCPDHGADGCAVCRGMRPVRAHPLIREIVRKYPYAAKGREWRCADTSRAVMLATRVKNLYLVYRVEKATGEIREVRSRV